MRRGALVFVVGGRIFFRLYAFLHQVLPKVIHTGPFSIPGKPSPGEVRRFGLCHVRAVGSHAVNFEFSRIYRIRHRDLSGFVGKGRGADVLAENGFAFHPRQVHLPHAGTVGFPGLEINLAAVLRPEDASHTKFVRDRFDTCAVRGPDPEIPDCFSTRCSECEETAVGRVDRDACSRRKARNPLLPLPVKAYLHNFLIPLAARHEENLFPVAGPAKILYPLGSEASCFCTVSLYRPYIGWGMEGRGKKGNS